MSLIGINPLLTHSSSLSLSRLWLAMAKNQASLLLRKQLKDLCKNPVDYFSVELVDASNVFIWSVTIIGPPESLYEGGYFRATMAFPENYPISPPTVRIVTDIWHPNVYPDGRVCISILNPPVDNELASQCWTSDHTVESIMMCIIVMLSELNDEAPANVEAAKEWRDDRSLFMLKVSRCIRRSQEE